uniref:Uncharacterized protein n=1 Tax=Globodera rostochiensis TaxID=31243 RepID=A0A914H4Z0_GLORO
MWGKAPPIRDGEVEEGWGNGIRSELIGVQSEVFEIIDCSALSPPPQSYCRYQLTPHTLTHSFLFCCFNYHTSSPKCQFDSNLTPKCLSRRVCKNEEFTLFAGFRQLQKHLRNSWRVEIHSGDELVEAAFEKCRIFVLPCPRAKFTEDEFALVRKFVHSGGSLLVMCGEGGEQRNGTNTNFLLEEFGIVFNSDCVIRTMFHKYFDPKEALVPNGVVNRAIPSVAGVQKSFTEREAEVVKKESLKGPKQPKSQKRGTLRQMLREDGDDEEEANIRSALTFVFPFGCTLNVDRRSVCVLSTGTVCYPISRPICAFHTMRKENGSGKLAVVGSVQMFTDDFFAKEDNAKIFDVIIKFLSDGFELNQIDAAEPDIADFHTIPDNLRLSGQLKMCLQESEIEQTFTGDFTKLFDNSLCSVSLEHWPEAIRLYDKIGLKHEPLTLVTPAFQVPMPPFQPAVFAPEFRELAPPQLELFDLDDAFATHEIQLAQLTNRCAENELDLYIREAGEILDINKTLLRSDQQEKKVYSKQVLEYVIRHIVEWKKSTAGMDDSDDFTSSYLPDESGIPIEANKEMSAIGFEAEAEEEDAFSNIDQYDDFA